MAASEAQAEAPKDQPSGVPSPAEAGQREETPEEHKRNQRRLMLAALGFMFGSLLILTIYKLLVDLLTSDWPCDGTISMLEGVYTNGATSNAAAQIDLGKSTPESYFAWQFTVNLMKFIVSGYQVLPMTLIGIYGWQRARSSFYVCLVLGIVHVVLLNLGILGGNNSFILVFAAWMIGGGIVSWTLRNWRVFAVLPLLQLLFALSGLVVAIGILPIFKDGSQNAQVLVRTGFGLIFAPIVRQICEILMKWGSRGEDGVPGSLMAKFLVGMVFYTLRLLQSSLSDPVTAFIMEVILQVVQLGQIVVFIEWGGFGDMFKAASRRMGLRKTDDSPPWWETNPVDAMRVASSIEYKEYLDTSGIIVSVYFGLMVPYTFEDSPRSMSAILVNGAIQLVGEVFAKATSRAYLRWRVKSGARVFDYTYWFGRIGFQDKLAMLFMAFTCSWIMVPSVANHLCYSCGGLVTCGADRA